MSDKEEIMYECDGCGMIGTEEEVEQHILKQDVDGPIENIKCWGLMVVGSDIWEEFHSKGIHPMTHVLGKVTEAIIETGVDINLRGEEK